MEGDGGGGIKSYSGPCKGLGPNIVMGYKAAAAENGVCCSGSSVGNGKGQ